MKKHLLLLCAFCVSLYGHSQKIYKLSSPDKNIGISISLSDKISMENFLPFRARYAHRKVECCHAEKENPLRGAAVGRCAIHPFPGRGGAAGRRPAH